MHVSVLNMNMINENYLVSADEITSASGSC